MVQEIDDFTKMLLDKWTVECWQGIQQDITLTLIEKDEANELRVNFTERLIFALKDIKVVRLLGCDVSVNLTKFFCREDELWVYSTVKFNCII